jgi:ketosteroid isomerase-like protein
MDKGTRDAFLAFMADNAVMFQPKPVFGKKIYQNRPQSTSFLIWQPEFAVVSDCGDLGYTTGPWEWRKTKDDTQNVAFGHFITLWKKQYENIWRFVIDIGVSHERVEVKQIDVLTANDRQIHPGKNMKKINIKTETKKLIEVEKILSGVSLKKGFIPALLTKATGDIRIYRDNFLPSSGKEKINTLLSPGLKHLSWIPIDGDVSCSGDLGYTYGIMELKNQSSKNASIDSSSYLHIWRKNIGSEWKLAEINDVVEDVKNINQTAGLKWILRNKYITTAIPGYTNYDHMSENFSVAFDMDIAGRIEELKLIYG